ncbi:MAG: hypothetical protein OXD45_08400 [Rhodobacteraceae bacterium]|nr:hypothetical protein [Paracoccaceae bacterium]
MKTWTGTPRGDQRKDAAPRVLEQRREFGIPALPPRRNTIAGRRSPIVHTTASDPGEGITCRLSGLEPLSLKVAETDGDKALWRELVDRHHCLGCPYPFTGLSPLPTDAAWAACWWRRDHGSCRPVTTGSVGTTGKGNGGCIWWCRTPVS